jgi:hypothetical protein
MLVRVRLADGVRRSSSTSSRSRTGWARRALELVCFDENKWLIHFRHDTNTERPQSERDSGFKAFDSTAHPDSIKYTVWRSKSDRKPPPGAIQVRNHSLIQFIPDQNFAKKGPALSATTYRTPANRPPPPISRDISLTGCFEARKHLREVRRIAPLRTLSHTPEETRL